MADLLSHYPSGLGIQSIYSQHAHIASHRVRFGFIHVRLFSSESEPKSVRPQISVPRLRDVKELDFGFSQSDTNRCTPPSANRCPQQPAACLRPSKKILKKPRPPTTIASIQLCRALSPNLLDTYVRFSTHYFTGPGESIKLAGSSSALGFWDPKLAPFLVHDGNGEWHVDLPAATLFQPTADTVMFEYKFVVVRSDTAEAARWEGGFNHQVLLTPTRLCAYDIENGVLSIFNEWQQ